MLINKQTIAKRLSWLLRERIQPCYLNLPYPGVPRRIMLIRLVFTVYLICLHSQCMVGNQQRKTGMWPLNTQCVCLPMRVVLDKALVFWDNGTICRLQIALMYTSYLTNWQNRKCVNKSVGRIVTVPPSSFTDQCFWSVSYCLSNIPNMSPGT